MTGGAPSFAVLGFRPHTYWTAAVALAGRLDAPDVLERRRIVFAAGEERNVYHHAAAAPAEAPSLIAAVREATQANAVREIGALIADLRLSGVAVRMAVVPVGNARLPERLEDILKAHTLMHAAEGVFYRDIVASACDILGLKVRRVLERDLPTLVAERLSAGPPSLEARMKAMGAALGPPWSEDYRLATQAAWLNLDAGSPPGP